MKTEKDIMDEMAEKVSDAKSRRKRRPNLNMQQRALKIIRVMTQEEVQRERSKVYNQLQKLEGTFPEYLKNFSAFKKSTDEHQERAVRDVFNKEFNIKEYKRRIKELDYILS